MSTLLLKDQVLVDYGAFLNKIELVAFELIEDNISAFNNTFSAKTHHRALYADRVDDQQRRVLVQFPRTTIINSEGSFTFADGSTKYVVGDGCIVMEIVDNKYVSIAVHETCLMTGLIIQDCDFNASAMVRILDVIGINPIYVKE